ncbi:hypothetical protein B0H19DRAFT_1073845 [Mycena capillaripes]|nr:hypothetical protein B0H19DRAFT_1073845 [Mycena capillaripes]
MFTKFISSAFLFLVLAQGAVAIVCGGPKLPACPTVTPCVHLGGLGVPQDRMSAFSQKNRARIHGRLAQTLGMRTKLRQSREEDEIRWICISQSDIPARGLGIQWSFSSWVGTTQRSGTPKLWTAFDIAIPNKRGYFWGAPEAETFQATVYFGGGRKKHGAAVKARTHVEEVGMRRGSSFGTRSGELEPISVCEDVAGI